MASPTPIAARFHFRHIIQISALPLGPSQQLSYLVLKSLLKGLLHNPHDGLIDLPLNLALLLPTLLAVDMPPLARLLSSCHLLSQAQPPLPSSFFAQEETIKG